MRLPSLHYDLPSAEQSDWRLEEPFQGVCPLHWVGQCPLMVLHLDTAQCSPVLDDIHKEVKFCDHYSISYLLRTLAA